MIQRIQSFWLVLAACCMALCFLVPTAEYHATNEQTGQTVEASLNLVAKDAPEMMNQMITGAPVIEYSQKVSGFKTCPLTVLAVVVAVIAIASIFLYKNRVRQMRVVAVAFLLDVVYVFLLFFWAVDAYSKTIAQTMGTTDMGITWHAGAYAPIVAIVFFLLAHRSIKKDEMKVRAADRLR